MGYGPSFGMFDIIGSVFPIMFAVVFITVLAVILVTALRGLGRWSRDNAQPRVPTAARVVAKRMDVSHHNNQDNGMYTSHTTYYATFEFESGDRLELRVPGEEYGVLAEGDSGVLTFQGTRYIGFLRSERIVNRGDI